MYCGWKNVWWDLTDPHTTRYGDDIARQSTRDEWLISFERLKIILLDLLEPFQLKCKLLNKIFVKQNAKKALT